MRKCISILLLMSAWSARSYADGFEYIRLTIITHVVEGRRDFIDGLRLDTRAGSTGAQSINDVEKFYGELSQGKREDEAGDIGLLDGLGARGWEIINVRNSSVEDPPVAHRIDAYLLKRPLPATASPSTQPSATGEPTK
jgi:hypothetical protein